jgi:NHLM bacteriocin system ABC transporter peptidase/ATP-binding protein
MSIWSNVWSGAWDFVRRWMPGTGRVRTPTILQMEAVECGAAALGMVLAHHGRRVPLERLRTDCGVSRDGSKASNIVRAARTYGLDARGFKKQPHHLADLPLPAILHWNFNHFVVFEGLHGDDGGAYLNDPASGPRRVPMAEFDRAFTGVVLTFTPTEDFEPGGSHPSLGQALRNRLRGAESGLLYVVLAGLALVVPGLVEPTFSKIFVDTVLIGGATAWVRPLLLAMGVTAVLTAGLMALRQTYLLRLEMKLALQTSAEFFWHVLRLPVSFFQQRSAGDVAMRVDVNDRVAQLLSGRLGANLLNVIVIVFYAALMLQYDVWLTLVVVATAALNLVALQWVARRRTDLNQHLLQERGKMIGAAMGGLQTIETLKATGGEDDFFTRWAGHYAKVATAEQRLGRYTQLLGVVPPFLLAVSGALILGIGGLRVIDGVLSIGMLIAFQVLTNSFIQPVNQMVSLGSTLQEVTGDLNRLDDVLNHAPDADLAPALPRADDAPASPRADDSHAGLNEARVVPTDARGADVRVVRSSPSDAPAGKLAGRLELEGVTFGYSPLEAPLLDGFDLALEPGMRVALVGGSGSGKSTVARLVGGLVEPWAGAVRFDGRDRADVPRALLISSFAFVDQQITLFEGTVYENLTLWDATIPEPDVHQAARDACIHEVITARPGGYGSAVEEGGRNFSGGQRQRLEIARALAGTPTLLVLDEATSALDPATEKRIDDHLRRRGCTCLIIAHRLSTIRDCDEILVLDRGTVTQRGTHEALVDEGGAYRELLSSF